MSAASLPPVGIDPNLRQQNKKGASSQLDKWRSDSKKAADRNKEAMHASIAEQNREFLANTFRYQEELRRKEAERQSKSKEFAAAATGATGLLGGGGASYIPPPPPATADAPTPVSRKRRAGDPIQTMDYHGAAMPPQMFRGGGVPPSCSGMFPQQQAMRLPNGAVYPPAYPVQQNGFAAPPPPQQQMMPQTSQSPNMMHNDRVPSEPCAPAPKSVATPPLYANPSPSTSATPCKNGVDAANNSPPNDPTPGSSSQSVAGDGCQLTDCLNVADDHEKTLDDMIKSNLGNELTDLGGSIHSELEDMELNNLLDRISDLIPASDPIPPTSSAPPSAPTVPTSNDNSPAVQAPMSAPGAVGTPAYGQIASPASVRSNVTPAPVQTVPQVSHNSPYGAVAPTPPMHGVPFSPPVQPVPQPPQQPQATAGFPMQSPQFPVVPQGAPVPTGVANGYPQSHQMHPHAQQMQMMQHQPHPQQLYQQQQQQYQLQQQRAAYQQHQMMMQQMQQRQMMAKMQQQYPHHQHPGYQQNGYNLPMQYPQGTMAPQSYHPNHYPTHQYPPTGYPMG
ncbi:hypothetical protein QR680_014252 [Steinernema hermaphroditum]|uniref:Uncharacterized protein n=1 Tax=Steinernema hermaphroditum TaxID=289476 RepID=A0AA39I9T0_9BILA|nr:hypothetical protein QR680_014252 [Steinernema hermaphroditum]